MAVTISEQSLAGIRDRSSLFAFLREQLQWPVDPEDTFTYNGPAIPGEGETRVNASRIVPFGSGDPFAIMLVEYQSPFRRSDLREVLRSVRREMRTRATYKGKSLEDLIFVCAMQGYSGLRFAHFTERDGKQPKISVFGWDTDRVDETRTLREFNLPALTMYRNVLDEPNWPTIRESWLAAWDVDRVTGEFFKTYREVFEQAEKMITGVKGDQRLFTQRLFNRLVFMQFLQKKRWLRFDGSTNYLPALFQAARVAGESIYRDRLYWVFFQGLGTLNDIPEAHDLDELRQKRGDVPYLNGGLFDMEDADDIQGAVQVPNDVFDLIHERLFSRYNFTVTESTPLDIEVAVDPEMLGKIFEELVTGRHDTGSYYTPKPIVSFMCREALKGYLSGELDGESEAAVSGFVDRHDPEGLRNPERALEALRRVRACDPACGSGAYLLGMLHELVDLRACLFAAKSIDAISLYERKLDIIQRNLYGVDIDQFAVNIARLRLWLSLIVEFDGDTPPPLPNLDFKIEVGDSLLAPDPSGELQLDLFRSRQIVEFGRLKGEYMRAHDLRKAELRREVETQKAEIAAWAHPGAEVRGFDWPVEFAEVFTSQESLSTIGGAFNFGQELSERPRPGGFDIVLANPPYVRQELIKEMKSNLKRVYEKLYSGTADLYVYFYIRALQLLRTGGMLVFISPNKWFRAGYGASLRKHIADTCQVTSITDFRHLPVFLTATAYPMIFVVQEGRGNELERCADRGGVT